MKPKVMGLGRSAFDRRGWRASAGGAVSALGGGAGTSTSGWDVASGVCVLALVTG